MGRFAAAGGKLARMLRIAGAQTAKPKKSGVLAQPGRYRKVWRGD